MDMLVGLLVGSLTTLLFVWLWHMPAKQEPRRHEIVPVYSAVDEAEKIILDRL